jgi:hypothetical protein
MNFYKCVQLHIITLYQSVSVYFNGNTIYFMAGGFYEACPESKDTKVLNIHNIFNLQKRHCERIACI